MRLRARVGVWRDAAGGDGPSGSSAAAAGPRLQVDLKGVVYDAWVLPMAATAMVLNIGPTEAKVGGGLGGAPTQ